MLTVFGVLIIHCFSTTSKSVLLIHSHVSNSSIVAPPSLITSDDVTYLLGLHTMLLESLVYILFKRRSNIYLVCVWA